MAFYGKRGKKDGEKMSEFAEAALMALYAMELQCRAGGDSGVGEIYLPGRAISKILGGKWSTYRHKVMVDLSENGWVKALKGYERNSSKKEVWRYSLTQPAQVTLTDRLADASRDCIWDYEIIAAKAWF